MNKELKSRAIQLRLEQQLSYTAIMKQLLVAKSTLSEWLRPFPLSKEKIIELRRTAWKNNEAKIELFRATMREKRAKKDDEVYQKYMKRFAKVSAREMFISGLILYLGEGAKTNNYTISLANTDPRIMKFFVKWLCKFFSVSKDKLKAHLHLYENMNIKKEKEFWKSELGFGDNQFYKHYITKFKKSSFLYKESFRHGTCAISMSNTVLKRTIMMAIKAYVDSVIVK